MTTKPCRILLLTAACLVGACSPAAVAPAPRAADPERTAEPVEDLATRCFGVPSDAPARPPLPPLAANPVPLEGAIDSVEVEVRGQLDPSLVRGLLSNRPGESVDQERIAGEVRRIWALGNFEDVSVRATRAETGWKLTYVVQERPVLSEVRIRGVAQETTAELEAVAGQHEGDLYVPASVQASAQAVREHLSERGHAHVKVESFVRRPDARTAALCMLVDPGPVVRVAALLFEGRQKLGPAELEAAVRQAGVEDNLPGGFVNLETLENQLLHVTARYYDAGMVQARVGEPEVRYSDDGATAAIHVPVQEGPIFRVGTISFGGSLAANAMQYRDMLGLRPGDVFNRSEIMDAVRKLEALRGAEGHTAAIKPETEIDVGARTIDLVFVAEE